MSVKLNKKEKGFTIIEVLIVLAIAGVIMLVVFLAVPALQRNSKNTQRRADVAHMAGLINEYEANNTGSVPASFASGAGNLDLANEKFSIMASPSGALAAFAAQGTATPAADTMVIYKGAVCSANVPTATNATPRSIVIFFAVESSNGNVPQCTQV